MCTCTTAAASGADCAELLCPNACSGNGQCDTSTGKCACGRGFAGPQCGTPSPAPTFIVTKINKHVFDTGISDALFGGLLVLAYFIGCFCALFCGGFVGAKIMQRKRDAQFSR